jgi:DNA-binding response OmpR family regulator
MESENGIEALDLLKQQNVDYIITDYMMPKMNGLDFIKTLKPLYPNIPILMLTAKSDTQCKLDVLRLGIDDYLQKPFEKNELLIRIQNSIKNTYQKNQYINKLHISKEEIQQTKEWIHLLKDFVTEQCSNYNLTQVHIAENFNISKSSLYRKIKTETGLSPNEFIKEIKLLKARDLTEKHPEISLKRLSLEVGFLHTSYFSKIYFDRFGHKPYLKNNN